MTIIKVKERGRETVNLGRRNMIINGAMQVAQRGNQTGATNSYAVDRFNFIDSNSSGVLDHKQSSTSPDGFAKSTRAVVTTAQSSLSSNSVVYFRYKFEGQDVQRLQYGTSSAKKFTLSYYVRSSITGTFTLSLYHDDANRMNIQTFTINSANTWEKKTHTFIGDTVSGFDNDNNVSFSLHWVMAAGTDYTSGSITPNTWNTYATSSFAQGTTGNILSAVSNEFLLTGVQMEIGETETEFEHRSFAEELSLCHRYYQEHNYDTHGRYIANGGASSASQSKFVYQYYGGTMRATPSVSTPSVSNGYRFIGHGQDHSHSTIPNIDNPGANSVQFGNNQNTITAGRQMRLLISVSAARIKMDAEL